MPVLINVTEFNLLSFSVLFEFSGFTCIQSVCLSSLYKCIASCFNDISTNQKVIKALIDFSVWMGSFEINTDILCILVFCVWALIHTAILTVTVSDFIIFHLALPDFLFHAFYFFVIYRTWVCTQTPHHTRTHTLFLLVRIMCLGQWFVSWTIWWMRTMQRPRLAKKLDLGWQHIFIIFNMLLSDIIKIHLTK